MGGLLEGGKPVPARQRLLRLQLLSQMEQGNLKLHTLKLQYIQDICSTEWVLAAKQDLQSGDDRSLWMHFVAWGEFEQRPYRRKSFEIHYALSDMTIGQ